MKKVLYEELLPEEFVQRMQEMPVAYLPLGTLEWHGPHMPLGADGIQSKELFVRVAEKVGGVVLPILFMGPDRVFHDHEKSFYGMDINTEGALHTYYVQQLKGSAYWLEKELFQDYLRSIFAQLSRAGVRIVVGHGHGPSIHAFQELTEEAEEKYGLRIFTAWTYAEDEKLKYQNDHAGANETSIVMAVRPDLVDFGQVKEDESNLIGIAGRHPVRESSEAFGNEILEYTMKTLISRSSVLMGIESLALDAEGEYTIVAESLGGINVVISPTSQTIINLFDVETEVIKDEITGKERVTLNIENKVEDVTQALLTMARGSTRSDEVNELTKQIIAESVAEEYAALGINSNPESLYKQSAGVMRGNIFSKEKKDMPTIGSWYRRIQGKARENTNSDYQYHYSYLLKVMKQYIREYDGQMAYFDGQSTFELLEGAPFINLDISQLEERFARPLAQQILLSWIWEKFVKKNSEDRKKATQKRVLVDEAWMLLPYPEAVDFLNKMARRARKRNVSLAIVSQRFQDFYEKPEAQAVLTSSDTKLFLAQDKSEIQYLKEVFKLSEGEANFLITCQKGEGLLKVGADSAILKIMPTRKEFEFVETNLNQIAKRNNA